MGRLKILIVDDEKYEAVLMEKCVDWQGRGFEIVGSAQSAREALALFAQTQPDIVLCDINMPVINGLELSRRLKQQRPGVHIIIVTGYREFAYAQQAVEIGVEKYVLKPVQAEELLKTAEKIRSELAGPAQAGAAPGDAEQSKGELTSTAVAYIESNLSARGLSLKGVASAVYANGSYLSRVFREEAGRRSRSTSCAGGWRRAGSCWEARICGPMRSRRSWACRTRIISGSASSASPA